MLQRRHIRRSNAVARSFLCLCGPLVLLAAIAAQPADAVPDLQLFVEGATWDPETETWVTAATEFDLLVIGANETIFDVKVAAAVVGAQTQPAADAVIMTAVDNNANSNGGFQFGTPIMGDGRPLPGHGIYPAWFTYVGIGDIVPDPAVTVYDMQPGETGSAIGQIVPVHVIINTDKEVHFDAYDHVVHNKLKVKFAPFSHDVTRVPEPGTLALLSSGLAALLGAVIYRRRRPR